MSLDIAGDEFKNYKKLVLDYINKHYGEFTKEELKEISASRFMNKIYENQDKYKKYVSEGLFDYMNKYQITL